MEHRVDITSIYTSKGWELVNAYGQEMGRGWPGIEKRLEEVRMHGRKRSMVG